MAPIEADDVVADLRRLCDLDVRSLDDGSVLGLFDALETADRLMSSARFTMLAEVHGRNLTDERLGHVVANEAGWRHGTDPGRVRRDLAVGNVLRRLPKVASALASGAVSVDRVRKACWQINDRTADTMAAIQDELLDVIRSRSTWKQFQRDVEQIGSYADQDGPEPPRPRNHASLTRSGDVTSASLDLYGTVGVGLEERLNAEADRLFRQAVADHTRYPELDIPPRSELLAQAFVNLIQRGAGVSAAGTTLAPVAEITIVVDVDDGTVGDLFRDGVLLPGPSGDGSHSGSGEGGPVDWSTRAVDTTGTRLRYSTREWALLTCDPTISWIITDAGGHPVACRTGERHASRDQRRGLVVRDGGCVFPGCDRPPSWCDAHHVQPHAEGGSTDVHNLALLCRHHHGVVHRAGWAMTPNPDPRLGQGFWTITSATGATLHSDPRRRRGRRRRRPDPAT